MSRNPDQTATATATDWTQQRRILGRRVHIWQVNLWSLLFILLVTYIGIYFSSPFVPLMVRQLGITDPGQAAIWSGIMVGLAPVVSAISSPFWGRFADRM